VRLQIEPIEDALHAGQIQVLHDSARFNVLECGRRFGKTHLGIQLAIDKAIDGAEVGWFAPTYRYLADPWRSIEQILGKIIVRSDRVERRMDLINGGSIDFWSLDSVDAGRGRRYGRVIIDEASIVRDLGPAWQETIRATLADQQGDAWMLGTPKGRNFFHRCFERGQIGDLGWKSWRLPTTSNPIIRPEEIEAAKAELPKQVFEQEFLGIPADDGGNPFGLNSIGNCIASMSVSEPVAFGIDLAKSVDWTVVCGLDADGAVSILERWQGPWSETSRRIDEIVGDKPALIDSTGVGDPIVEGLQKSRPRIEGFKFSQTSKQQLMEGLASAFQTERIRIPDGWLRVECETFEYTYTRTGVRYEAPSGLHDDGVCALALALRCNDLKAKNEFDFRVL
tara:strand:- start:63 stop:1247 length:1185 start_codon:yes stop_codon:yes gene_type:complete